MYHLAEFNIARLRHPLDAAESAEFAAALDPINAIAETTPGFVWRLTDASGASSSSVDVDVIDDPLTIVNYSVWESLEALKHFAYKSGHVSYFRRRAEWFERSPLAPAVCWWTPSGTIPPVEEAYQRLLDLRANGPSERGWPPSTPFPRPG